MRLLLHLLFMLISGQILARPHIVVVTATTGFRHDSIETAELVLAAIVAEQNADISFIRTEDELAVLDLQTADAVFFVNTTGELPLSAANTLLAWIRNGGTFAGVHSASDTWHSLPDYLDMIGAEFVSHPPEANGEIVVVDATHPATKNLDSPHVLFEEFYEFGRINPPSLRVLLSLESKPLAWEKSFGLGRVVYTALGHRIDVWQSAYFRAHLSGIVQWALTPAYVKRRSVRH
ncbi:MAG TPA: ThuA domain-containing protein [Thermoanaerobaculia bacterium]